VDRNGGDVTEHFCTYFDANYLARGLALFTSLKRHVRRFRLYVLCLDRATWQALRDLREPDLVPVALETFEAGDAKLMKAKQDRSTVEYYFTCTPSWLLFVFRSFPEVERLTYVDADLFLFDDPSQVFAELGGRPVWITPHRHPDRLRHLDQYGLYNVNFLVFQRDDRALQCLQDWRERCLEWCHDRVEGGRFADQKYLDDWPARFPWVGVVQNPAAGVAPWNVEPTELRLSHGRVLVGGEPLIAYHFHALKVFSRHVFDPGFHSFRLRPGPVLVRHVYGPYLRELRRAYAGGTCGLPAAMRSGYDFSARAFVDLFCFRGPLVSLGSATVDVDLTRWLGPVRSALARVCRGREREP